MTKKQDALLKAWRDAANELGADPIDCSHAAIAIIAGSINLVSSSRDDALEGVLRLTSDLTRTINEYWDQKE